MFSNVNGTNNDNDNNNWAHSSQLMVISRYMYIGHVCIDMTIPYIAKINTCECELRLHPQQMFYTFLVTATIIEVDKELINPSVGGRVIAVFWCVCVCVLPHASPKKHVFSFHAMH